MKKILMSLLVIALMLGVIGAASTAGLGFTPIGILSLGYGNVGTVGCDFIGFNMQSGLGHEVVVSHVRISLTEDITDAAVSVSLRASDNTEQCFWADNHVNWDADDTTLLPMSIVAWPGDPAPSRLPFANEVFTVKVTVAENSTYNTPPASP